MTTAKTDWQVPFDRFGDWLEKAIEKEPNDPTAMALATVSASGMPSLRMVLLKDWSVDGFVFYTNLGSRKAQELAQNPHAALLFHWKSLRRQVRVEGSVMAVSDAEADAYFASRSRASQLGAWASRQSTPMKGPMALETRVAKMTAKFGVGAVPRPDFWSGYRLAPVRIEFWDDRMYRLHDRTQFDADGDIWIETKLFP